MSSHSTTPSFHHRPKGIKSVRSKLLSMVIGTAAVTAAVLVAQLPGVAQAAPLPTGTAPAGVATIIPSSGNSASTFGIQLPLGANCPGDGGAGHRWHTFIAPSSVDVSQLSWTSSGGILAAPANTRNLFTDGGSAVRNQFPVSSPVLGGISSIPGNLQLAGGGVFGPGSFPDGTYKVGIACSFNDVLTPTVYDTTKFYQGTFTIATDTNGGGSGQIIFGQPAAPAAPVVNGGVNAVSTSATSVTLAFTHTASIPASTFSATATGGTAVVNSAARTITVSGIALGTPATVSLTADNTVAPAATSNTVTITRNATIPPAPIATFVDGTASGTVNWTAPASGPIPIGYIVRITGTNPVVAEQTITLGNVLTTGPVALLPGTYSATVQAQYAASEFITSPAISSAVTGGKSFGNTLITQEITVTRPNLNVLILTQRCGVNGALAAESPTLRFPRDLAALVASADQVGTAPTIAPGYTVGDPGFPEYPVPSTPVYPTRCGLALGNARMITAGTSPLRGRYFTASGALNQVTVADFRDADAGWVLTGTMADFAITGDSFSGNYLGWTPATPIVTPPTGGYTQTVGAGPVVQPGDGVSGLGAAGSVGLGSGRVFATGAVGTGTSGGQGIADMNARVKLLIPVSANQGNYAGILTFTVV